METNHTPKNHPKSEWPILKYDDLKETIQTVQLWTQIIGKIRLKNMPWINHSWHVSLYVSSCGLTTGAIPYEGGNFEMEFDFREHSLHINSSLGQRETVALASNTISNFYGEVMKKLENLGIPTKIHPRPNEIEPAIAFFEDQTARQYDKQKMNALWLSLVKMNNVFTKFRAGFLGKCSPVHFFWGGFDLALTRFSGREAPKHSGGVPNMPLEIMQEAYSHEVSSCGFWPGGEQFPEPVFYSYCYPTPSTFGVQQVKPSQAFYSHEMGEFFLRYEDVHNSKNPEKMLMEFLQTTYEAAANTGNWDRQSLEFNFLKE